MALQSGHSFPPMPTPEIIKLLNHGSTPRKFHKSIAQTKMSFINLQLENNTLQRTRNKSFHLGELKKTSQKRKCLKEGQHFGNQKFCMLLRNKKKMSPKKFIFYTTVLFSKLLFSHYTSSHQNSMAIQSDQL